MKPFQVFLVVSWAFVVGVGVSSTQAGTENYSVVQNSLDMCQDVNTIASE